MILKSKKLDILVANMVLGPSLMSGTFRALAKKSGEIVPVARDWVMMHFEPDVVKTVVVDSLGSFVLVEKDVKVVLDRRQIQKVCCFKPENKYARPYFERKIHSMT